ncbi:hypothetical protein [Flammeovirga sp. EKP202]|uniref:hypothetical protein n=1 Tax=Flammeovirga sp. EKP202 TaxID=2770592 RepID=UPI00165EFEE0|nr:hypothetical protein [Flammeovirga sp. EKP202]MBD0400165.1 hypothetical protein [Flammeovirga sp. EKP202]
MELRNQKAWRVRIYKWFLVFGLSFIFWLPLTHYQNDSKEWSRTIIDTIFMTIGLNLIMYKSIRRKFINSDEVN